MIQITQSNIEQEVLRSEVPVILDFWAPWCRPCGLLAPTLEELERQSQGHYRVAKVNVDHNRGLAINYNVSALPTLKIFHQGEVVETLVGVHSGDTIRNALPQPA